MCDIADMNDDLDFDVLTADEAEELQLSEARDHGICPTCQGTGTSDKTWSSRCYDCMGKGSWVAYAGNKLARRSVPLAECLLDRTVARKIRKLANFQDKIANFLKEDEFPSEMIAQSIFSDDELHLIVCNALEKAELTTEQIAELLIIMAKTQHQLNALFKDMRAVSMIAKKALKVED